MSDHETELPPLKKPRVEKENEETQPNYKKEMLLDFSEDISAKENDGFSMEETKYSDFVSAEEIERLKEFQVLDELKSNDEESDEEESDSSDGKSEGLPEEEIEKMLDEDLPENLKGDPKPKPFHTRQKVILEVLKALRKSQADDMKISMKSLEDQLRLNQTYTEKGINYFEVLPLDWTMVRHYSGMPVYMHRSTRVCTLSKPYALGKGNTRRHDIPISAIPCLNYRKALEEEGKQNEKDRRITEQIKNGTWVKPNQPSELVINTDTSKDGSSNKNVVDKNDVENVINESDSKKFVAIDMESNKEENSQDTSDVAKCPFASVSAVKNDKDIEISNDKNKDTNIDRKVEGSDLSAQPVFLPGGLVMLPPRVESVNTSWKTQHLTPEQFNDYCKALFKFKTVNILHFKRWADRRKYTKSRKTLQYPTLPEGTKLITIPAQPTSGNGVVEAGAAIPGAVAGVAGGAGPAGGAAGRNKRDWVMNMNGRSYLSVFHEYVRRALEKQPVYEFKQLENAATPYQATVYIGGMQYGSGRGTSKRLAKAAAARSSIQILIPEAKLHDDNEPHPPADPDFSFFDYVGIEDPRMSEFCAATCEPSPHAILRTCLLRNFGAGDRHIHTEMKKLEYQKISLTMKVGKHSATVVCKNKKTAKQRASQAILQALHPHVRSWGSLLRLYGSRSVKSCKEKKMEEQQITLLQDKARHNEPNYAVIEKLRHEMTRLRERDEAVVPIGTLLVSDDLPTHSGSNLNNVDL